LVETGAIKPVPNPAHDAFEMTGTSETGNIRFILMLNQLGEKLAVPYSLLEGDKRKVDISSLKAGVYYVQLICENGVVTTSLVKY
jgi:hypothetical protein